MTSKNKVIFNLNANLPQRIRLVTLHPKKEWLALITTSNTFSLWNYKQKILIKSFNSNTLDDSKNFEIREMVFFDRHSLPYPSALPMRTNIIFLSPTRIYLYDYLTDAIKQINEKDIEQKTIRKVPLPPPRFVSIPRVRYACRWGTVPSRSSTAGTSTARTP
jgi:hypothetical protein